jgi:hypothetical protein
MIRSGSQTKCRRDCVDPEFAVQTETTWESSEDRWRNAASLLEAANLLLDQEIVLL